MARAAGSRRQRLHGSPKVLPVSPARLRALSSSSDRAVGQDLLDDILTNPRTVQHPVTSGNFIGGTRYIMPNPSGGRGFGATFDSSGEFQYFGRY